MGDLPIYHIFSRIFRVLCAADIKHEPRRNLSLAYVKNPAIRIRSRAHPPKFCFAGIQSPKKRGSQWMLNDRTSFDGNEGLNEGG